jgi:hypothetical protein
MPNKWEIEAALRHGQRIVEEQQRLIRSLKILGGDTSDAERALKLFQDSLSRLRRELRSLERASGKPRARDPRSLSQ